MIDKQTDPVNWALLMYQLEDAQEGLAGLFRDIAENSEFSEAEFAIHMRHIYGHLNRAWNSRNLADAEESSQHEESWDGRFPADMEPF